MANSASAPAARPLILLVEDDEALGRALKFALEVGGYAVDLMVHAEALLDCTFAIEPVCIVTDQQLPGASGLEALEALRRRGVESPAILVTTGAAPAVRARAARIRVVVMEKPILGDELMEALRGLKLRYGP